MARIPVFFQKTFATQLYGALHNENKEAIAAEANLNLQQTKLQEIGKILPLMGELSDKGGGYHIDWGGLQELETGGPSSGGNSGGGSSMFDSMIRQMGSE